MRRPQISNPRSLGRRRCKDSATPSCRSEIDSARENRRRRRRALHVEFELIGVETDASATASCAPRFIGLILSTTALRAHAAAVVFERPGRLDEFAPVDAKADDLVAGEHVHAFEA